VFKRGRYLRNGTLRGYTNIRGKKKCRSARKELKGGGTSLSIRRVTLYQEGFQGLTPLKRGQQRRNGGEKGKKILEEIHRERKSKKEGPLGGKPPLDHSPKKRKRRTGYTLVGREAKERRKYPTLTKNRASTSLSSLSTSAKPIPYAREESTEVVTLAGKKDHSCPTWGVSD